MIACRYGISLLTRSLRSLVGHRQGGLEALPIMNYIINCSLSRDLLVVSSVHGVRLVALTIS